MNLPFSTEQFFDVIAAYNRAVWPAQFALVAVALAAVALAIRRPAGAGRAICGILAALWAWMALAYHWAFFTAINPAAWAFGLLCLAGAAAFAVAGVRAKGVEIDRPPGARALVGWGLVGFALLVYPVIGHLAGHAYPATPSFGLPCPTTIFTVGMLMLMAPGAPRWLHVAPLLWALVGASAAFLLGVYQDLGLIVAALASAWSMRGSAARRDAMPAPSSPRTTP